MKLRGIIIGAWLFFGMLYASLIYLLDRSGSQNTAIYLGTFTATFVLPLGVGLAWALKDTGEIKESVQKTERLTEDFDDRVIGLVREAVKDDLDGVRDSVRKLDKKVNLIEQQVKEIPDIKTRVDQIEVTMATLASCEVKDRFSEAP